MERVAKGGERWAGYAAGIGQSLYAAVSGMVKKIERVGLGLQL